MLLTINLPCRWLHTLYLAIDANFRLKLKARNIDDPELGSGWAYFVEQTEYEKHVRKHFKEKEVRSIHVLIKIKAFTHFF